MKKNRGTGAGGSNTNKNGLPYEELTDLNSEFIVTYGTNDSLEIVFNNDANTNEYFKSFFGSLCL